MTIQFCQSCKEDVDAVEDEAEGRAYCPLCGYLLEDLVFESGPSFIKEGDTAHVAGTLIRDDMMGRAGGYGYGDDSRERSVTKGRHFIEIFAHQLNVPSPQEYIQQATRVYQLAISSGFTRGRRTNQVAAACLYIVLRQDQRPYMLIDFCNLLSVNVYVLGVTYLRLTERLRLDTHPIFTRPVDPSLFIHRFAGKLKLPERKVDEVCQTAIQLIAQMKRDWLQTGRRPAGVCGAALWLATHIHGFHFTRKEVIKVVSVGEATLQHRISELRGTSASDMTLSEFKEHAKLCLEAQARLERDGPEAPPLPITTGEGGEREAPPALEWSGACCRCVVNKEAQAFAFGMCQQCYTTYIKSSGGIFKGARDPPAYIRNLRKEIKEKKSVAQRETLLLMEAEHGLQLPAPDDAAADEVEAEFALALLENDSTRELAEALGRQSDMPTVGIEAARAIVSARLDGDRGAGGADGSGGDTGATASAERRTLQPAEGGLTAAALRRAAHWIDKECGFDFMLVSDDTFNVITDAARARAVSLSQQNAEPAEPASKDTAPQPAVNLLAEHGDGEARGDEDQEAGGARDADENGDPPFDEAPAASAGHAAEDERWSDIDDDEIDRYLATSEEIEIKKDLWFALNSDWEQKQALKRAAAAAAADAQDGDANRKKRGRVAGRSKPKFVVGRTAEESVTNMFAAKNLTSRLNKDALHDFFVEAEKIAKGVSRERVSEQPVPPSATQEALQAITQEQQSMTSRKASAHQEALAREGGRSASFLDMIGPADARKTPARRLGRLG